MTFADKAAMNRAAILLVATVPATFTAVVELVFNTTLPPWVRDVALVLIISVESLICWFSFVLAEAAMKAESTYEDLIKLADDVKKPLQDLKEFMLEWKDLLPDLTRLLKAIPKERVRKELGKMVDMLTHMPPTVDNGAVLGAANRLTKTSISLCPKCNQPVIDHVSAPDAEVCVVAKDVAQEES